MVGYKETICIVTGDAGSGDSIRRLVQDYSHRSCAVVTSLSSLRALVERQPVAAVLLDCGVCGDDLNGYNTLLNKLPVAVFNSTPPADDDIAPVDSIAQVKLRFPVQEDDIRRILRQLDRDGEIERSSESFRPLHLYRGLVGDSKVVKELKSIIDRVSPTAANILLLGETGTGKEVVARNIHYRSANNSGPFVPVNCSAIPSSLLESELFGHKKGSFTGATSDRIGRFEAAAGGTLFLDEIGDMPIVLQVKLLRVLEDRMIFPLGGDTGVPMTARLVAATHRDLEEMVERGEFREDLYYRLNVVPITVPPLRQRSEDIPSLCRELGGRMKRDHDVTVEFSPDAMECLQDHDWPGNVRELANLIERLTVLYPDGVVDSQQLRSEMLGIGASDDNMNEAVDLPNLSRPGDFDLKDYLRSTEAQLIRQALDSSGGVVARAAELLDVRRTTLAEKVKRLGLSDMTDQST